MAANGLAKLIEECGELIQVAGKKLAYYRTNAHPDGGPPLSHHLEDEIADVVAVCKLVIEVHGLNTEYIDSRILSKLERFRDWHANPNNNVHGVDAPKDPS